MIVQATNYDKVVTIELDKEGVSMDELTTIFKGIAYALEFSIETVNEYLLNDNDRL
jgi:hypothetical protein